MSVSAVNHDRNKRLTGQVSRVFGRRFAISVAVAAALLLVALAVYTITAWLLFFAAILFAILLRSLSDQLAEATPLGPGWALTATVAVLLIAAGLLTWLLAARVETQINDLSDQLSRGAERVQAYLADRAWGQQLGTELGEIRHVLTSGGILGNIGGMVSSSLGAAVNVLIIFFLGLYLAINPRLYMNGFLHLIPQRGRERARQLLGSLLTTLRWWLVGRFLSMLEVGVLTAIGLWLIGVPLPIVLGVLTGLMNFVPNLGPILATALTGLVGLSVSPLVALYAIVAQCVIGCFDGFVVTPLIQQRTVSLPAGIILGAQVLIGILLGGLGVLLATPLAAVIYVIVRKLYVADFLGDEV